jgi:hypothetical protein
MTSHRVKKKKGNHPCKTWAFSTIYRVIALDGKGVGYN